MRRLAYRRRASREIRDAAAWYDNQRIGLGTEFFNEIDACVIDIRTNPYRFALVFGDIREGVPARFPYRVYYRIRAS